jgi:flagellar biosynthesis protein FliP
MISQVTPSSLVLIGISSGCTVEVLTKTLDSVFDAVVLIVGVEEIKSQRNIERLKRELRASRNTRSGVLFNYRDSRSATP